MNATNVTIAYTERAVPMVLPADQVGEGIVRAGNPELSHFVQFEIRRTVGRGRGEDRQAMTTGNRMETSDCVIVLTESSRQQCGW